MTNLLDMATIGRWGKCWLAKKNKVYAMATRLLQVTTKNGSHEPRDIGLWEFLQGKVQETHRTSAYYYAQMPFIKWSNNHFFFCGTKIYAIRSKDSQRRKQPVIIKTTCTIQPQMINERTEAMVSSYGWPMNTMSMITTSYKEERKIRRQNNEKKAKCQNSSWHSIVAN